jgi:hypothetical protein
MAYQYSENIYSTESLSTYREVATKEDLVIWGFKAKKGSNEELYIHPEHPHIKFKAFRDTDNHRGHYRTVTLYKLLDSTIEN